MHPLSKIIDPKAKMIKDEASRLGFIACGISQVETLTNDIRHLDNWLREGMHGHMAYMARNTEKRANPALLMENAKTVISVAVNYYPGNIQAPELPQIAKYAYRADYHMVVKNMLHRLLHAIKGCFGNVSGRAFVDSAPVMEHAWAARSGLGWIGKHSLIIHPQYGSYIFLGELFIDLQVQPDKPVADHCGSCTRCIDSCPTGAIVTPRKVDARRCLSYLTIEHKAKFEQPVHLHNRLFGCDICQDVCPWNKKAQPTDIHFFKPDQTILEMKTNDWLQLSEKEFKLLTAQSPMHRTGYEAIRRNAVICQQESIQENPI